MSKKEMLLKLLEKTKVKLEVRKKRFELWQDEVERKDENGKATIAELEKSNMWWIKQRRLEYRIEFIENKIKELEKRDDKDYWQIKFGEVVDSIPIIKFGGQE